MIIDNVVIRSFGDREISIAWTSLASNARSFIFINGKVAINSFMAGTINRNIILPVAINTTFKIEVHEIINEDSMPNSIEEMPLVRPLISWNSVEDAVMYKIYHTIFDVGSIESSLLKIPARTIGKIEIICPIKIEGKGGKWHSFRVECVDKFGNESVNKIVPYFAADLPLPPELVILRNTKSGLLSFHIR
jgi:hypothetical protein